MPPDSRYLPAASVRSHRFGTPEVRLVLSIDFSRRHTLNITKEREDPMPGAPILVVDDAPVNLKLMRLLLTHEGYEVRTAERAEDALEMLSDYRPELILADIKLPGMNGLEMTRQVKENPRTRPIRVVALTACAMQGDREKALNAGCEDYISKPINTAALASKIREVLARHPNTYSAEQTAGAAFDDSSHSRAAIESLRRRFLEDGCDSSRRLLESLNRGFDAAFAARQAHEWIGTAGLLGYTRIAGLARQGEEALREEPVNLSRLRSLLTDLLFTFAELRESGVVPVPEYVMEATSGKRIALVGFTAESADAMCGVLEQVKARPLLFEASDDPGSPAIRDCDMVVFSVRPETRGSSWLQSGESIAEVKRLVYMGSQQDLNALPPDVRSRTMDFLIGRPEPQEVLMRLAFAFSRGNVPAPAAAAPSAPQTASDLSARPRMTVARPGIVLADDDGIVRALVGSTLQNYGMSCRTVSNGFEALALIRSEPPHVAVLDVNMPGMDGYEVLAAIRAENIPSRVILLTSLQQEQDVLRAFNLGADDYVSKPFNPFELVARLRRLLQ